MIKTTKKAIHTERRRLGHRDVKHQFNDKANGVPVRQKKSPNIGIQPEE